MEIQFFLPQRGETNDIYLNISDKNTNTNLRFRTFLKIDEDHWDIAAQRPKNIYLKTNKIINSKLDIIRLSIIELYKSKRKKPISVHTVSRLIKNISQEENYNYPLDSFLGFMQQYIASRKPMICKSTYKRYMVFFRLLERFQGYVNKRLIINDINHEFVHEFIDFGKKEDYSENTIYRSIHFVKTILNYAERKGIRTFVRELEIRREGQRREMITISEDELQSIKNCDVPDELVSAKKWLLISCYTGQRISDFMQFNSEKLIEIKGIVCISFMQKKTHKEITLPLHPAVMEIVRKNGGEFPKSIEPALYNVQIREIARLAGLRYQIRAKKRIGYRVKTVLTEKCEMLTSHIGRRSFATNFYGKIPTPLLMDATGHSTEQMFLKYINRMDNNKIVSLSSYFNQTYEVSKGLLSVAG